VLESRVLDKATEHGEAGGYLRALMLLLGLQLFCVVFAGALRDGFQKRAVTCVVLAGLWMSLVVEGFGVSDYTGSVDQSWLGADEWREGLCRATGTNG
jgi:hypothetical protein